MVVELISYTPNPEKIVFLAGRTCYHSGDLDELIEEAKDEERVRSFIRKLIRLGHLSVLEFATFTFWIDGISRVTLAQLTRHRLASYAVRSHRRVKVDSDRIIIPESISMLPVIKDTIRQEIENLFSLYNSLIDVFNVPIEDARYILPQCITTALMISANARQWRHMIKLRTDKHAQWELRKLMIEILDKLIEVAPSMFEDLKIEEDEEVV